MPKTVSICDKIDGTFVLPVHVERLYGLCRNNVMVAFNLMHIM